MDGILVVDKPKGMTSHDIVAFVRKRFELERVGHAGTLDPIVTGVLILLLGKFTKVSNQLLGDDKEYEAALMLGATSDTGDAWGRIESTVAEMNFDKTQIEEVFKKFLGTIEQIPPMYSAVKFKGKKLYELARQGISVKRQPRKVFIKNLEILDISLPDVAFKLTCSKGTYVRQLCMDIGERLGCGAYMTKLRRTKSGRFNIEEAIGMEELKMMTAEDLENKIKIWKS